MMSDKLEFVAASGFHRTFEKLKETLIKRLWFKMKNGANEKDASTVIGLILRCWNSSSAASPLDVRKAYGLPIGGRGYAPEFNKGRSPWNFQMKVSEGQRPSAHRGGKAATTDAN